MGKETKCKLSVDEANLNSAPYVAHFSNGIRPAEVGVSFQIFRDASRDEAAVFGSTEGVDFVSEPSTSAPPPHRLALAVFDRERGKVRIVPVGGGKVFRMEPRAQGTDYGKTTADGAEDHGVGDRKVMNRRLVDAFGSVRRRRQLLSRDAGKVQTEAVGGSDALKAALAARGEQFQKAGFTKEALEEANRAQRNLPPHNGAATTAAEAYRLKDIIPSAIWDALPVAHLLKLSEDEAALEAATKSGEVHRYVLDRVASLRPLEESTAQSKQRRKTRARALCFVDALLKLHGARRPKAAAGGRGLAKDIHIPETVADALIDMFYVRAVDEEGREKLEQPKDRVELLVAHILVVACLAEDWTLAGPQFDIIRQELKMASSSLIQRARECGFACAAQGKSPDGDQRYKMTFALANPKAGQAQTLADLFPKPKKAAAPKK